MMNSFFELYERQSNLSLEIGHNSIADWGVRIYDTQGCLLRDAPVAVYVEDCGYELALAKAYVALCEYLGEKRGGY